MCTACAWEASGAVSGKFREISAPAAPLANFSLNFAKLWETPILVPVQKQQKTIPVKTIPVRKPTRYRMKYEHEARTDEPALSAITQCARDLEGWSRALEKLAPSWLQGFQAPATSSRSLRPRLRGMPATQHRPGRRPGLWHPGRWRMARLWGFSPRWAAERGVHRRPRPRCMAR